MSQYLLTSSVPWRGSLRNTPVPQVPIRGPSRDSVLLAILSHTTNLVVEKKLVDFKVWFSGNIKLSYSSVVTH